MQTIIPYTPMLLLTASIIYSVVNVRSVYKGNSLNPNYVSINLLLTFAATLMTIIVTSAGRTLWPGTLAIQILSAVLLLDSLATTIWFIHRKTRIISFDLTHDPFGDDLTDENLRLLSDIIHKYKDTNRGWKEGLLEAMALELKLLVGTDGRYEPDTTYNVKDKVYSPDDIDLDRSRFKNLLDSSVPEDSRRAFLEIVAELATQSQTEPEEVMCLLAKNPECIFTLLTIGCINED